MNNNPIDIVVPWVNPEDENWKKDFDYWKIKEPGEKGAVRFRDMGTMKYWFRCIEENCKFVRYIFLLLASPSQIPEWLNTNNPKLKIVYHKDFIPEQELPTFNSSVINCYIPFIEELSENYILFNDDFFVIENVSEENYFKNDLSVNHFVQIKSLGINGNTAWYRNIYNNAKFTEKYLNAQSHFIPSHGPISFKKSIQQFIWSKFNKILTSALSNSRFRTSKNFTDWLFFDIQSLNHFTIKAPASFVQYINTVNFKVQNKVVCFNDTERLTDLDFKKFKNNVNSYLNSKFPNKCSYEK